MSDKTPFIINVSGRIDSTNAAAAESDILAEIAGKESEDVVIDASALEYISSAGLRVILRIKKLCPTLKITGVSAEVYDIFEMTGFTEMMDIEKAYRVVSVEGCEVIGEGANGKVYRIDGDNVVKTYKNADALKDIQHEREVARLALVLGIPTAISCLLKGRTGVVRFTLGGFIFLTLLAPFQGVAEELTYRGYLMQTVSSWFRLPVVGLIVQVIVFSAVHPFNILGVINIAFAAITYALVCIYSRGLEAGSALHIIGNMTEIYLAGFGIGAITSEQTVVEMAFGIFIKILFLLFVLYAEKKLHWFDEVKCDDVAKFNAKKKKRIPVHD